MNEQRLRRRREGLFDGHQSFQIQAIAREMDRKQRRIQVGSHCLGVFVHEVGDRHDTVTGYLELIPEAAAHCRPAALGGRAQEHGAYRCPHLHEGVAQLEGKFVAAFEPIFGRRQSQPRIPGRMPLGLFKLPGLRMLANGDPARHRVWTTLGHMRLRAEPGPLLAAVMGAQVVRRQQRNQNGRRRRRRLQVLLPIAAGWSAQPLAVKVDPDFLLRESVYQIVGDLLF